LAGRIVSNFAFIRLFTKPGEAMMFSKIGSTFLLTLVFWGVTLPLAVLAQPKPSASFQRSLCEGLSDYMMAPDGRCVNLTYLNGGRPQLLPGYEQKISRFEQALASISVPLVYAKCDKEGLLGFYDPRINRMTVCDLTQKFSQREIYETLVHESWHTVQDCISGLENATVLALSKTRPDFFQTVLGGISLRDFFTVVKLYPKSQYMEESEARFMQDKPELVLDGLRRCRAN
jgi:hypothetical protein